jgi:hypothetical protein
MTQLIHQFIHGAVTVDPETNRPTAKHAMFQHLAMKLTPLSLEPHARTDPQLLPRMHQGIPPFAVEPGQQQALDRAAGGYAMAEQSGRKYAGVVDDEQIARPQQIRQIGDASVPKLMTLAVDQQEPSGFAVISRRLRDQLGRKVEIKI